MKYRHQLKVVVLLLINLFIISSSLWAQATDKITTPIEQESTNGEVINDTYFCIRGYHFLGLPPDVSSWWGGSSGMGRIDFVFQALPEHITVSYSKGDNPPTSKERTALTQSIVTSEGESVAVHSKWKRIVTSWTLIIFFFVVLFAVILIGGALFGKLEIDGWSFLVQCLIAIVVLSLVLYATSSYNYLHLDNATDIDYIVEIDDEELEIPSQTHIKVYLNCGSHTFSISDDAGHSFIENELIKIVRSDLLVYNIAGHNRYTVQEARYEKSR